MFFPVTTLIPGSSSLFAGSLPLVLGLEPELGAEVVLQIELEEIHRRMQLPQPLAIGLLFCQNAPAVKPRPKLRATPSSKTRLSTVTSL